MKHIVIIAAAIVSISAPCFSQVIVGIQSGLGFATQSIFVKDNPQLSNFSLMTRFTGGIMGRLSLTKNIGVQAELHYLRKGTHFMNSYTSSTESFELHIDEMYGYFEVPIMISYTLPSVVPMIDVNILAGPSVGILASRRSKGYSITSSVAGTIRDDFDDVIPTRHIHSTDFSITAGLGVNLNLSSTWSIMLSGRYLLGLSEVYPDEYKSSKENRMKNRTIIVMTGVGLRL